MISQPTNFFTSTGNAGNLRLDQCTSKGPLCILYVAQMLSSSTWSTATTSVSVTLYRSSIHPSTQSRGKGSHSYRPCKIVLKEVEEV